MSQFWNTFNFVGMHLLKINVHASHSSLFCLCVALPGFLSAFSAPTNSNWPNTNLDKSIMRQHNNYTTPYLRLTHTHRCNVWQGRNSGGQFRKRGRTWEQQVCKDRHWWFGVALVKEQYLFYGKFNYGISICYRSNKMTAFSPVVYRILRIKMQHKPVA